MPTAEAWHEEERGEIALGGCMVEDPDGEDSVCKACGRGFTTQRQGIRTVG
jgi:hypothetical protein